MPGLIRGMAKTAAVVGTATATRNAVNRRQANKNAQAYANAANAAYTTQAPPPQQYEAQQPAAQYETMPSYAPEDDMITKLERLGNLYAQGILSDEEFAAAKQKLLAS